MEGEERKFKKIFLVEPSHDFSVAKNYTANVVFITSGNERAEELPTKIESCLKEFDPEHDAIVSMGRTIACLLTGLILGSMFPSSIVTFGVFRGSSYEFQNLELPWGVK